MERASTPLSKDLFPNLRVTLEISHSSVEANADYEENFNSSLDSLETICKRLKLSNSFVSVESGEYPSSTECCEDGEIVESPESPDEEIEETRTEDVTNSEIFIVENHKRPSPRSVTSATVADYLEQIAQEDSNSYFVTPPGQLKKIVLKLVSPLNDLEAKRAVNISPIKSSCDYPPRNSFQIRQPGYAARPMTVALSQSAPGLDCGCKRIGYGRGHGCTARLAKRYFGC